MPSGRGHSTDRTRVQVQKVRIDSSDRWILLKFFSRVSGGCFGWSSVKTVRHVDPVGAIPPTRLEYRVKRSVSLDPTVGSRSNFFNEFLEAVFNGVARNRYDTTMSSGRGHSTDRTTVPGQKVRIYRSDRWIPLKFFSRVSEGWFGWSSMESVHHADAIRSGPFHRQD